MAECEHSLRVLDVSVSWATRNMSLSWTLLFLKNFKHVKLQEYLVREEQNMTKKNSTSAMKLSINQASIHKARVPV